MENLILFTLPTCSKCKIIKIKLERKKCLFEECCDIDIMHKNGIMSVPVLKIPSGEILKDFTDINNWVESV